MVTASDALRGPMVGRGPELARLRSLLERALAGEGRLVLCTGEAGIGKTRLAEELTGSAAAAGVPSAWARATDRGSSPPFGLWKLVLEELDSAAEVWDELFGAGGDGAFESARAASSRRFERFSRLRHRLREAAGASGLLLVLDDVQWADEASMALLVDLSRQLRGARLLIVATHREPALGNDADSSALLALSSDAGTERVELRGLSPDEVAELMLAAGSAPSPEDVAAAGSQTGGNPFLVKEVARALRDGDGAVGDRLPVSGRVVQATAYRVAQLSGEAQAFLRAAAVAGNGFSVGVVARMLGRRAPASVDPMQECRRAGFLVDGDRPGDQRFSHALVRSAVVARLSAADERSLHGAAAAAIEGLYQDRPHEHLAEIARHRIAASLPGNRQAALAACEAAALAAGDALAYEEAARLYREALSAGGDEVRATDRARLELGLATALQGTGDLAGWHETASAVARAAERRRDPVALAGAALVMEATGDPQWDAEMCRVCEAALSVGQPAQVSVRVRSRYARALVYRNRLDRADEVSGRALQVAEETSDPACLVEALHARQLARSGPGDVAERHELSARMLDVAPLVDGHWAEMWGRLWRMDTLFETGRLAQARGELADLDRCARRLAGPTGRWHVVITAATLAVATGRYAEARRLAEESFVLSSTMNAAANFGGCSVILGQVGMHIGFPESGLTAHVARLPAELRPEAMDTSAAASSVFPALTVAMLALQRGDRAGAEKAYAHAGPARSWAPMRAMSLSCWAHGLLVAIGLGRTTDIEYLARRFEPFRGGHVANGAGCGVYMGPVELQIGKAAAALGRLDQAGADLDAALAGCRSNGARGYAVEAAVELAGVLARRGLAEDAERVPGLLDRAAGEARRLGMGVFTRRIDALRGSDRSAAGGLSRRELDVAQLVGEGLTNKQIAAALYIAERTAENHVQHILRKLGLANRVQVAAWISARAGKSTGGEYSPR